jgi:hypothetical protein
MVVGRKADRVLNLPLFQRLAQLRLGKGRIGAEELAGLTEETRKLALDRFHLLQPH